jgi:uncharacterized protein (TIGR02271 family)
MNLEGGAIRASSTRITNGGNRMSRRKLTQAIRIPEPAKGQPEPVADEIEGSVELREERLVAHKETHEVGEIQVHTEIEQTPGRLEVDAYREEVTVEHEPVGEVVTERVEPWQEADGAYVLPVYEERLVVVKRLVLRERIRIRRVGATERQLFEDTLRRERLVIEDPQQTGRVRELYPADDEPAAEERDKESGFFEGLVRKALE